MRYGVWGANMEMLFSAKNGLPASTNTPISNLIPHTSNHIPASGRRIFFS